MSRDNLWAIYCLSSSITAHWSGADAVCHVMFLLAIGHSVAGFFGRRS